jgi:hypothetical protein
VILAPVHDGFVAELTYGEDVDWYRNLLAAGGCVVLRHRVEFDIGGIEPYPADRARRAFPLPFRLILRGLGRDEFRLLRTGRPALRSAAPPGPPTDPSYRP